MRDSARSYVKKARKGNYNDLQDRIENDPFFHFTQKVVYSFSFECFV